MEKDYALVIAWPETYCKQTGSWYDPVLNLLSIADNGYYKVGHAAVVLINGSTGETHYFDFGRYHAPKGYGRVRSKISDHDLELKTQIKFRNDQILNIHELIRELNSNESCHGNGPLVSSLVKINFHSSFNKANELQERIFIKYGPFIPNGTNCSRFINSVVRSGVLSTKIKFSLFSPVMLTPTPVWNVQVSGKIISQPIVQS
ncbi:MAG: hypothetical protein HYZ14_08780 [Bacteroidetes bacterium]|nr:hypothetical protein [Bacteroidota bacterium]